jgi:hypothetical protein
MVEVMHVLKGATAGRKLGSGYNAGGLNAYPIANGHAENIGEGDFVKLSAGKIQLATNLAACLGAFAQVEYIDSEGKLQCKRNFVAGTSSMGGRVVQGGYTQPVALVYDDANQTYIMRTNVTASAGILGRSFKVSAIGSVVNGRSQAVIDLAASAGTSAGYMVTVVGPYLDTFSGWDDSPAALEVKLANAGIVGEL